MRREAHDPQSEGRATRIRAIIDLCLALDPVWLDCCLSSNRFDLRVRRAAAATHKAFELSSDPDFNDPYVYAAQVACSAAYCLEQQAYPVYFAYFEYVRNTVYNTAFRGSYAQCAAHYARSGEDRDAADWDQAATDVMLGYAVGCITQDEDVAHRIRRGLDCVDSDRALDRVLERITQLQSNCEAWRHQNHKGNLEEKGVFPSAERSSGAPVQQACVTTQEARRDSHREPQDAKATEGISALFSMEGSSRQRRRLVMVAWAGVVACSLGMVLPVSWGMVVPWVWVCVGACMGGALGCKASQSQASADQVMRMLMGWTVISQGVAWGLSWGISVWPLAVSCGAALAVGAGATALCVGGLGALWSQAVHSPCDSPTASTKPR